eukprot:1012893_1
MAIVNEHYGKDNISHDLLPLAQRFTRSLEDRSKDDFMHGSVVCYHDFGSMDNWFFKPQDNEHPAKHRQATHANLKEEILNSTIQSISMDICTKYMNKANAYLKYSNTVKRIRSSDRTSCTAHHVQINAPMSIQHVLSVILWCDNDGALSNALCNAFKTQHAEDNHYHHWSTYLLQAVQCFGDSLSTKQRFYHCVIPIPTDHDYNGVVLELQEHLSDINNAFRYLDCSIFSSRSNTDETLFFGGLYPLKICNVNDRTNRSFKPLIDTPALLKQVIQGQPYDRRTPNTVNLIERLSTKDKTLPEYARRIFECFCDAREESVIDLTHLNLDYPLLKEYLLSPEDVLYVSKLTAMFQNCARVKIVNDTNKVCISSLYLTQLRIEMTNEDNERVFEQSSLKELSYMNVLLDDACKDPKQLQLHRTMFNKVEYEFSYHINQDDTTQHDIILTRKALDKTQEYMDLKRDIQQKLEAILTVARDPNARQKEYETTQSKRKTKEHLINELEHCSASKSPAVDIYTHCECAQRLCIVLTAYKRVMASYRLCRNVSLQPLLTFGALYGQVQINDDFDHVRKHIEENEDAEDELHHRFKDEFKCVHPSCRRRYGDRKRWRYKYHFHMDENDRVWNDTLDKIHQFMVHTRFTDEEQEKLSVAEINTKRGYIGKKEDNLWWQYHESKTDDDDQMDDERVYQELIQNAGVFRWQCPHGFASGEHQGLMHLKPKYKN